MKKHLLIAMCCLAVMTARAQTATDSLINAATRYIDKQEYDKAIEIYTTALKKQPGQSQLLSKAASAYLIKGDYRNAVIYSGKVLENTNEHRLEAYLIKGSALDLDGKDEACIETFKAGIKEFGYHPLLSYNLAFNYYRNKNITETVNTLERSIYRTPTHPGSHLLLANALLKQNKHPEALLALYYFLLLEPNTERSITAFSLITEIFDSRITTTADNEIEIITDLSAETQFANIDLLLSLLVNQQFSEANRNKTGFDRYLDFTSAIFGVLSPDTAKMDNYSIWWDLYVPFFSALGHSGQVQAYCYFTTQSLSKSSLEWIRNNPAAFREFSEWVNSGGKEQ
ncbi:MAG: hypothetical protein BGO09_11995 [Bacteroidetes bacterium 47-18]|nr:MAG: hypothetical protein BGO09_11995 [Bacteroidetes bacterium 47-18]